MPLLFILTVAGIKEIIEDYVSMIDEDGDEYDGEGCAKDQMSQKL